ncbi:hypothetical protein IGI04_041829 [Brassica rapa subsp. trilocularis]|uniref:Uncharacterized protein n=1 Tax=Brassica rapa subsp. trilocularis TaxID=1813537 RepID=A0ABQ7KVY6_BRACM|nr:hypothetical protein IGI04_041829 [Brassica rapa subsp. trilocularis]
MESCKLFIGRSDAHEGSATGCAYEVTAPPGKAIRFFGERTTKPSRGSLSPSLLCRRRSPSLFVLSEPEKRERRWYLCHYLNIISGRRNLYLRCFGLRNRHIETRLRPSSPSPPTWLPYPLFPSELWNKKGLNFLHLCALFQLSITIISAFKIYLILSWTLCLSAAFDRYCCKSMMLHERSSQEESLYSTGLSFFTPEMISDLRYLIGPRGEEGSSSNQETSKRNTSSGRRWTNVLLAVNINALGLWVSFLCHDRMYIAQVASNGRVLTWGAKKAVTGMKGADVLSSVKMF